MCKRPFLPPAITCANFWVAASQPCLGAQANILFALQHADKNGLVVGFNKPVFEHTRVFVEPKFILQRSVAPFLLGIARRRNLDNQIGCAEAAALIKFVFVANHAQVGLHNCVHTAIEFGGFEPVE